MPPDYSKRLSALRRELSLAGFDGLIVPRTDEYQNEYIPPAAERVAFLCGFTGSAATLVILRDRAAFFTDGRYTLQAAKQVSSDDYALFDTAAKTPLAWLEENATRGMRIAYDPWLHAVKNAEQIKMSLAKCGASAVSIARNIVDGIWTDKPAPPMASIYPHDIIFAGKTSAEKRREIAALLRKKNIAATIINSPAEIAWLLNIRGGDVENTPLPLSRAILNADGVVEWFVDPQKMTKDLLPHLGETVNVLPPEEFPVVLDYLARSGKTIFIDPHQTPSWIVDYLTVAQGKIDFGEDVCALPRAIKNDIELKGMRAAHCRDGVAMVGFLAWLDAHWKSERLTELDVERKLATFREANIHYRGPSFETISATGAHGAIVHYRATEETNAPLTEGQLYLVDSGGQYLDGTTDVTRTVILGEPTSEMRENYTRVLKGHIALASVRFPDGTTGAELDVLARQHLWAAGRDYSHGTGHGVGCYLSVHEGPTGISKRNNTLLKPGMVLSNEPGYYKEGHYGIRIENVQAVVEIPEVSGEKQKTYGFEPLTVVPMDQRLINAEMLTEMERDWLNSYHQRVYNTLSPILDRPIALWLEAATKSIEK